MGGKRVAYSDAMLRACMSAILFHSESAEPFEIRGSERHWASHLASAVAIGILRPSAMQLGLTVDTLSYALTGISDHYFKIGTAQVPAWELGLNTALVMGDAPLRLLTRLHAQCEIHAWIAGEDRQAFAEIIAQGRRAGVLRPFQGWSDLARFLRKEIGPIVTSYTVTDYFPNHFVAERAGLWAAQEGDEDGDAWYDLPAAEQWRLAFAAISSEEGLQLRPDLRSLIGDGLTAFDLLRELAER